jgi:nanoRNase/pAp phosphatase (c-di-AMP/oligoRNAs hydrolase)
MGRGEELISVLKSAGQILILPHGNPDPDALASGAGLRALIYNKLAVRAPILRSGTIGRAENRAVASALQIRLELAEKILPDFRGSVVLVDTQPGRKNNVLPQGVRPVAVIDHHPDWGGNDGVPFVDLREEYGATSTIVTEYLQELEVPIDARLATALFYGIASETRNLGRETRSADIIASQFLYPFVNKRLLGEIETPRLSPSYFSLITAAVRSTILCDDVTVTLLDKVPYPDAVAEVADLLIRLEDVSWSICLGRHEDFLYVSLRSNDPDARAGSLLASILPDGSAGGHGMIAGGRISLMDQEWGSMACEVAEQILQELGKHGQERAELMPSDVSPRVDTSTVTRLLGQLPLDPGSRKGETT